MVETSIGHQVERPFDLSGKVDLSFGGRPRESITIPRTMQDILHQPKFVTLIGANRERLLAEAKTSPCKKAGICH